MSETTETDVFEIELAQSDDGFALAATVDGEDVIGEPGHTVTVNWGDGSGEVLDAESEPHRYSTPGPFDVSALLERDGQPSQKADAVAQPVASEPEAQPQSGSPDGTIDEVKAWVGDDPDRAQTALDAENEGQQRQTLIAWLELRI